MNSNIDHANTFSRRQVLQGAGALGFVAASGPLFKGPLPKTRVGRVVTNTLGTGTAPEQVHLTYGNDPTSEVVVSWASPEPQPRPRLSYGTVKDGLGTSVRPEEAHFVDGVNGQIVYFYHARLKGLTPHTAYHYRIDDGASPENAMRSTFTTASEGRHAFRFTSFGDLATPNSSWADSGPNSAFAVSAVEAFHPLFHLLNGDLSYANLNMAFQPEVWRDFGVNFERSAANRPWMTVLGNHEVEFGSGEGFANGPQGYGAYLTRFRLPSNGIPDLEGRFYAFRVGSVLFLALDGNDAVYEDDGAVATSAILTAGGSTIPGGATVYNREYSGPFAPGPGNTLSAGGNRQTRWLEAQLKAASKDPTIDWVIAQMHQNGASSSAGKTDLGIRQAWLPLFDKYKVDLVLSGHSHDYERSFPVRGFDHNEGSEVDGSGVVDTNSVHPIETDLAERTFHTAEGTVHLVLGGGGTSKPDNVYALEASGVPMANVMVERDLTFFTAKTGLWAHGNPQATEPAPWSAVRDPGDAYGIAVFDVDPGSRPGGRTTIHMRYYHAPAVAGGTTSYSLYDEVVFVKNRSDGLVKAERPALLTTAR